MVNGIGIINFNPLYSICHVFSFISLAQAVVLKMLLNRHDGTHQNIAREIFIFPVTFTSINKITRVWSQRSRRPFARIDDAESTRFPFSGWLVSLLIGLNPRTMVVEVSSVHALIILRFAVRLIGYNTPIRRPLRPYD